MVIKLHQQEADKNIITTAAQLSAEEMEPIIFEAGNVAKD
jgi:hypothetical protein